MDAEALWKKTKRTLRRPFEMLGIALGVAILSSLPHRAMLAVCDFISFAFARFDRRGMERARRNLRIMFGGRLSPKREKAILRRSYRNMARTLGHIFWTCRRAAPRAAAAGRFAPETEKWLDAHKPAVTVSCHMGCWEILSQLVYLKGRRIVSVAKPVGSKLVTSLLMRARRSLGQEIVPADGAFKHLFAGLRGGADIGLLVDQCVNPKAGGLWVRFFGEPICVSAAPAFLAAKAKAPMVLAWSRPLKDGTYRCEMIGSRESVHGDIWSVTQQIILDFEKTIRRHPSAWVLNYRYWTDRPKPDELAKLDERIARCAAAHQMRVLSQVDNRNLLK